MKIFVTGGAGFIGSAFIHLILQETSDVEIVNFDALTYAGNPENLKGLNETRHKFVKGDICDKDAVLNALPDGCEAVFNFAAESHVDRSISSASEFVLTNVLGTQVLLDAARAKKVKRFVQVSCYDEETKALTKDGLKDYRDLKEGDQVLSINQQTGKVEEKVIIQDYEGEMIHFKTFTADLKVTPNHRMYYRQTTKKGLSEIRFDEAQNILNKHFLFFPRGRWKGKSSETIYLKNIGDVPTKELFYVCGVFIGDGFVSTQTKKLPSLSGLPKRHADEIRRDPVTGRFGGITTKVGEKEFVTCTSWRIFFDVPEKDKARLRLETSLDTLGVKWTAHKNKSGEHIYICSKEWTEFFSQFGKGFKNKHIPDWLLTFDESYIQALFDGLIDSDGHYRPNGRPVFSTSSERLMENICELSIKLGMSPRIKKRVPSATGFIGNREIRASTDAYMVYFRTENVGLGQQNWKKEYYKGKVWCVKVEDNKNLIVERNGILQFCGNTDEVMGSLPDESNLYFTEISPLKPNSPYAASKAAAEHFVRAARETFGLDTVITRCGNNYGPRQFPEKLIPLMIANALDDEPLPVYGDGRNVRDWIYVEDHARAIWLAFERGNSGEVYNIGARNEQYNIDVVKAILDALGKPHSLVKFVADRLGHDRRYAIEADKAESELGWKPLTSWEEGLQKTIHWYQENQDWVGHIRNGAYRDYYQKMYGASLNK
jgi:dTDP-D-glucose 4,6-dehydratase